MLNHRVHIHHTQQIISGRELAIFCSVSKRNTKPSYHYIYFDFQLLTAIAAVRHQQRNVRELLPFFVEYVERARRQSSSVSSDAGIVHVLYLSAR
jgi:hypothetical protein